MWLSNQRSRPETEQLISVSSLPERLRAETLKTRRTSCRNVGLLFPRAATAGLAILVLSCGGEDIVEPDTAPPTVTNVLVSANPYNELSTVATFTVTDADSARITYWATGEPELSTPYQLVQDESASVFILGLSAGTRYSYAGEAIGPGGRIASDSVQFQTGQLPEFLKTVAVDISGTPTPGYTLFGLRGSEGFMVAIDESGSVRWYRQIEGYLGADFGQKPNGNFTAFIGETSGWQPTYGYYAEFEPSGEIVARYSAPAPLYTDNHEIILSVEGTQVIGAHLFSYDLRRTDLSMFGGPVDALVAGHQILRLGLDGTVEFMWNAWDHFVLEDWIEEPASRRTRDLIDFDHPNSLDIDHDGHYVASFRELAEITKLDSRTGGIIWRFGGRNNQFTIENDPLGGFNGQHSVRVLANGNLLIYDNGLRHVPPETRALEYRLDVDAMTATLIWEYRHSPPIYTPFVGSIQRLANGNTFIGYGGAGRVTEVDPSGAVVWEGVLMLDGTIAVFYRGLKIQSLYRYEPP